MSRKKTDESDAVRLVRQVVEANRGRLMTAREIQHRIFDMCVVEDTAGNTRRRFAIPTSREIAAALRRLKIRPVGQNTTSIRGLSALGNKSNLYSTAEEGV